MKSRDVIGKRIVAVHQERATDASWKTPYYHLRAIELEDGTRITFLVVETAEGDGYGLQATARRR